MSEVQQMAWMNETNTLLKQAVGYEQDVRQLENLTDDERGVKPGQSITFTNAEGKKLTGVYQSNGDVVVTDGNYKYTYHDVYRDFSGNYKQITDNYDKKQIKQDPQPSNTPTSGGGSSNTGGGSSNTGGGGNTNIVKGSKVRAKANTLIYDSYDDKTGEKQTFSSNPNYVVLAIKNKRAQVRHVSAKSGVTGWFNLSELTLVSGGGPSTTTTGSKKVQVGANVKANPSAKIYGNSTTKNGVAQYFSGDPKYKVLKIENNRAQLRHHTAKSGVSGWIDISQLTAYKTGGLVDFTGLAWLDGTKNKPETVLNYKDTQNFIDLKDNLNALRTNGVKKPTQTITNNPSFTINVNVDEISNDYDVDRLVDRVKRDILQNSGYRNVTAINFRK